MDTPETVHPNRPVERFGKEASAFTRRMVEGKPVRVEFEEGSLQRDRYGRTLAYVYIEDGGQGRPARLYASLNENGSSRGLTPLSSVAPRPR